MSFLTDYLTYNLGNEAHEDFHRFCGLVALSSIVSRRVWIDMGYFQIYPNLYVVLVGIPASRKTTAMSQCKRLLRCFGNEAVPLSAESQTRESAILEMVGNARVFKVDESAEPTTYSPLTICVTELSQFIGAGGQAGFMMDFLTTIYDEPVFRYKTKHQGDNIVEGPYLCLLGCTTRDWITARLRDDIISGGFSRRVLFVHRDKKARRVSFPEITQQAAECWQRCVLHGRELLKIKGAFAWDAEAKAFYKNWYEGLSTPADTVVAGYYDSKHIQLLKITMLIALSEDPGRTVVLKSDLLHGLDWLHEIEANLVSVFSGIGRNELNSVATKVLGLLDRSPGKMLTEREVKAVIFRDAGPDEIIKILSHLQETRCISIGAMDVEGKQIRVVKKL